MGTNKPVTMTVETTVHAPIGKCGSIERSQSTLQSGILLLMISMHQTPKMI